MDTASSGLLVQKQDPAPPQAGVTESERTALNCGIQCYMQCTLHILADICIRQYGILLEKLQSFFIYRVYSLGSRLAG